MWVMLQLNIDSYFEKHITANMAEVKQMFHKYLKVLKKK